MTLPMALPFNVGDAQVAVIIDNRIAAADADPRMVAPSDDRIVLEPTENRIASA